MRRRCLLILMFAAGLLTPSAARAILIEAGGVKVGGYIASESYTTLKLRIVEADGERTVSFDKAKINIIHRLDRTKLEKLSKDNPKAYADLADALAEQQADPEARDVAMRLFLIAAYLDPAQFGGKSLMRMSRLAPSPAEARRCRAMAFVLDPNLDSSVLRVETAKPAKKNKAGPVQDFLKALQYYRMGTVEDMRRAKDIATKGLDKIFRAAPGIASQAAFQQLCSNAFCGTCRGKGVAKCALCKGTGVSTNEFGQQQLCTKCKGKRAPGGKYTVSACETCEGQGVNQGIIDENLRTVLRAELWALDQLSGVASADKRGDGTWSATIQARRASPAGALSLKTITEFDPRKCVYRGGLWVAP